MEARHGRGRALPRDQESRNKQDLQSKGIGRATKAKSPRSPTDENTDSRERCRMMIMMMMMMKMMMMMMINDHDDDHDHDHDHDVDLFYQDDRTEF